MKQNIFSPIEWSVTSERLGKAIFAGPCSAETEEQTLTIAQALSDMGIALFRASLWKPRTKPGGFEGVGIEGIPWLQRVRDELGMQVATEVATTEHLRTMLDAGFDTFWIGARTTSSPFAITEIANFLRGMNVTLLVKNPMNPDLALWEGALLRLQEAQIRHIGAIHRGFSTYGDQIYRNTPYWQIPLELKRRYPNLTILCDPSHIAGKRSLVEMVSQTAIQLSFDGLMIETHHLPQEAWSDREQQVTPEGLYHILQSCTHLDGLDLQERQLYAWRQEIDLLDEQLLHALGQRMELVRQIGALKQSCGMSILQTKRYEQMLANRFELGEQNQLAQSFVREIFDLIHQESIKLQKP